MLVPFEDANIDDDSRLSSPAQLPQAQARPFWGQKPRKVGGLSSTPEKTTRKRDSLLDTAKSVAPETPQSARSTPVNPINTRQARDSKLARVLDTAGQFTIQKAHKLDTQHCNAMGLKLAHRECLAKVCALKEQLAFQEKRAADREKALSTALTVVKLEYKNLRNEVSRLHATRQQDAAIGEKARGRAAEEPDANPSPTPIPTPAPPIAPEQSAGPLTPDKDVVVAAKEAEEPSPGKDAEAEAAVEDGIRRISGQFIAQEASKSSADGERAQQRVAKLQKLVQEAQKANPAPQAQGVQCAACAELRRQLLAAQQELKALKEELAILKSKEAKPLEVVPEIQPGSTPEAIPHNPDWVEPTPAWWTQPLAPITPAPPSPKFRFRFKFRFQRR